MAAAIMPDRTPGVTGGIDTHKDTHVAAVVDSVGAEIATRAFPTTADGYRDLTQWLGSYGRLDRVGVEGCGSWGAGISRHLTDAGHIVVEINRPNRQKRRSQGKSDPLDALSAARVALGGLDAGEPKSGTGPVESIRMFRNTRTSAIQARTATMNQIRSVLDTAPTQLREQHRHLSTVRLIKAITKTRPNPALAAEPAKAYPNAKSCAASNATSHARSTQSSPQTSPPTTNRRVSRGGLTPDTTRPPKRVLLQNRRPPRTPPLTGMTS